MFEFVRPLLFALPPASAHRLALTVLLSLEKVPPLRAFARARFACDDARLHVHAMGLTFPSPLGLAAGFDKNARAVTALAALGFGHIEVGTVTAIAQHANPSPNLFRLRADEALVNRLGFPNDGAEAVCARLARVRRKVRVPIGVSIGKSRVVPAAPIDGVIQDYLASFRAARRVADFVVVNISSPNTKDLRTLQQADLARALFAALAEENGRGARTVPLLVKLAPDLGDAELDALLDVAHETPLAGVVATNTTVARDGLRTDAAHVAAIGAGGLSGAPLRARALAVVARARARLGAPPTIIGVGGVACAADVVAMLAAGANLVQMYTGFVYRGPGVARAVARALLEEMDRRGVAHVADLT